ncbi:hypothetical protein D3C81_1748700 [compost metagenome]
MVTHSHAFDHNANRAVLILKGVSYRILNDRLKDHLVDGAIVQSRIHQPLAVDPLFIPVIHNLHIGLGISNLLPKCRQRTVLSHGVTKQAAQQSNHINGKMPLTLFDHIHDILQRIVQEVGIDLSL